MSKTTDNDSKDNKGLDLVVIGGGPGGYSAAIRAARLGLQVHLVEAEQNLGGVCLNWGCIPTKALLRQAEVLRLLQRAGDFGLRVDGEVGYDWEAVIARSRAVAGELASGVAGLMKKNRITVVHGRGRLTPSRSVEVTPADGGPAQTLRPRHVLLATGGRPRSLPGIEIDGERVISSREAMSLPTRPKSLAIIGAGAIGVEFASFYRAFGTKVTMLEAEDQVLPREDPEISQILTAALHRDGIDVHTGVRVTRVDVGTRRKTATVEYRGADGNGAVQAERVLMAVGVTGNTEDLGLGALGLQASGGSLPVDGCYATKVKNIYAIGDLTGPPQLAHAAAAQGIAAVEFMAGRRTRPVEVTTIPSCTYSHPQVASVGLSEAAARSQGLDVKVGRFPMAASGRARASGDAEGMIKLVFGARYGDILGAAIVGPEATELIAEVGLAITLEATWEELAHTVHAHPTLSEGVMEAAAAAFGEAINI
jgi:dihydrolipoamide dehydrogenase